jgi:hypothetical protein
VAPAGVIVTMFRRWSSGSRGALDLPEEDLTTAGRVLSTVTARANAELGGA